MKKVSGGIGVLSLGFALLLSSGGRVSAADRLTQIADNVYAYVNTVNASKANSFGANAGIVIGTDGIIVVDTLMSAKEAQRFIRDIRAVSGKPIKFVVNSHYHPDHTLGNCEFARLGAVIIAQEKAKKAMEDTTEATLKNINLYGMTPEDMEGTVPTYPTLTYSERTEIDIGGQKVELVHARNSHTEGDTLVFVPGSKVLFTGDILYTNYHPFVGEANIPEWGKQLDEIAAMDIDKIIPGHGPLSSRKDLADMKEYLFIFDELASDYALASNNVQEIASAMEKSLPHRPEGAWIIAPSIVMKYLRK